MLAKIMGHSSTSTTQHYAHVAPDFFGAKAFDMVAVDLTRPTGNVVDFGRSDGQLVQTVGRKQEFTEEQKIARSAQLDVCAHSSIG